MDFYIITIVHAAGKATSVMLGEVESNSVLSCPGG